MTRGAISTGLLRAPVFTRDLANDPTRSRAQEGADAEVGNREAAAGWNPEKFAREQIRGLVRQIFFSDALRPVRQVAFSALEGETEVRTICRWVGEALAPQITGQVALVGAYPRVIQDVEKQSPEQNLTTPLGRVATRVRDNFWLVPNGARDSRSGPSASWHSFLAEVRSEFEYSIVQGPVAGESDEATAVAQAADGIVLVLSAERTRRATARRVKEALVGAHANILGTVLSDREFPIPEAIYRRL